MNRGDGPPADRAGPAATADRAGPADMAAPAERILTNAVIYTLDEDKPWATGLAIGGGRVLAVGDQAQVADLRGPRTTVRDMAGAFVMPGMVDVHNHHAMAGRSELFELHVPAGAGLDGVLAAVRGYAAGLAPDAWIVGGSWESTLLPLLSGQTALRSLDQAAGGRPVLLTDDSHHNRWASSRALQISGITAGTDPPGGAVVCDPVTGQPTGLLLEAAGLIAERALRAAAPMTHEHHIRASRRAIETLHAYGVTAFQDAGVSIDIMRALKALDDADELRAWVVTSMLINDHIFGFEPIGAELMRVGQQYRSAHHRPDFVKIFLDGVPPAHTAAFLEPYLADDSHGAGFLGHTTMPLADLTRWLRMAGEAPPCP